MRHHVPGLFAAQTSRSRSLHIAMLILAVSPAGAPAQDTEWASAIQAVKVGQHVRVDVTRIGRVEGTFLVANDTTLTLVRDDVPVQVGVPDIELLWVRGRAARKGAVIGGGVGLLVGIVGGILISSVACAPGDGGDCTAVEVAAVTGLLGGVGGAAIGGGVGAAVPTWRLLFP